LTNFRSHKNDLFLLRAFARLAQKDKGISLVFAGKPAADHRALRELIEHLDLRRRVHLPGLISDEDLPSLYAGAELFAFPSLYEGFGLPVLEAMASEVPVVCSSSSSLPEIAEGAALLVSPTDEALWSGAMADLLADRESRKKWTRAGLSRARTFTWRRSVTRILEILEEAVR
jgi:glycosyltransferase involved in cell wall biosynthesis